MSHKVCITCDDDRWSTIEEAEAIVVKAADAVLQICCDQQRSVSVLLTNSTTMHDLNKSYRQRDKSTNVLAFPAEAIMHEHTLGDIAVSYDHVTQPAEWTYENTQSHLAHLIVHGVLHLLDYDHIEQEEAEVMEKKEREILSFLGYKAPSPT